jgi:RND superfamily putative drug exporter
MRLSTWAVTRPARALLAWVLLLLAVGALAARFGGEFNDSFELPDTESATATELLTQTAAADAASGNQALVVWSPSQGQADDPAAQQAIAPYLEDLAALDAVTCVQSPFGAVGTGCETPQAPPLDQLPPEQAAALQQALEAAQRATSPVSEDGSVAYATLTLGGGVGDVSPEDAKAVLALVEQADEQTDLAVGASGSALGFAETAPSALGEIVGVSVALVILLVAFGSLVAAALPIVTALVGLAGGLSLVVITAAFLDVATFGPTLAAMIGLGVGIDYALFITNRYRQSVQAGHDPRSAALESVRTSGRAVAFAGTAVIIALLGLLVLGVSFFYGLALAAAATVLMMMLGALWFLPALLSLLGDRALAVRMPWARRTQEWHPEGGGFAHYGRLLQRRPWVPLVAALAVVLVVAAPMLSMRLGFSDDGGRPESSPLRVGYDLMAEGFGAGVNGPFFVATVLKTEGSQAEAAAAVAALEQTPGVARTLPSAEMLPLALQPTDGVLPIQVVPESAPQDEATTQLLDRLRDETLPELREDTGVYAYVGGVQAITSDFTSVLAAALPLFLAVVVGLGFLALVILFRSILVPLTGAVTSLLSLAAALGITTAVFQWGWGAPLIGVESTGPIFPFLPVMVFAILFGLSMDYQVFLVSRMQEEWNRTGDNLVAVRRGLAGSGRVVVIAALIMASVFLAFVPSPTAEIKVFGVALGAAVLIDAFVVRLVLVPALMTLLGRANWWLPGWLGRVLPQVQVEGGADEISDDPEIERVPAQQSPPPAATEESVGAPR